MIKGRGERPTPVDHMRAPQGVATLQKTGPAANRYAARAASAINEVVTIANSKTYGGSGGPLRRGSTGPRRTR